MKPRLLSARMAFESGLIEMLGKPLEMKACKFSSPRTVGKGGLMVTEIGFIPHLLFRVCATYEPSLPPLTGTTQSKVPSVRRCASRIASRWELLAAQSSVRFFSAHTQALQKPRSSKLIRGLVDIAKH